MDSPAAPTNPLLRFWRWLPFRFHWLLVLWMGLMLPLLTAKTDKPGEFYPFSNFPMYSSFSPDTYFVWVSDLNDQPVAIARTFGMSPSDLKKRYDRKLSALKKEAPKGLRKAELPLEFKQRAGRETLEQLLADTLDLTPLAGLSGLRLHHVDILYQDDQITQETVTVGEVPLP